MINAFLFIIIDFASTCLPIFINDTEKEICKNFCFTLWMK